MTTSLPQSAADWCFCRGDAEPARYYSALRGMGVTAAEMVPPERWAAAKAAGLKLLNLCAPGMEKGLNRLENHGELLPQIRKTIQDAAAQGIPHVIVFSGNRAGLDDAHGIDNCATGLGRLAGDAEKAGVTLLLEVLNSYEHVDYQCDHSRFAYQVVSRLDSPGVRMLYDIYHMHRMGEDVAARIVEYLPFIAHLHVAGSRNRGFPGDGQDIDYRAIVRTVQSAGYTGFWGQEFVPAGDSVSELTDAVRLFFSYA